MLKGNPRFLCNEVFGLLYQETCFRFLFVFACVETLKSHALRSKAAIPVTCSTGPLSP